MGNTFIQYSGIEYNKHFLTWELIENSHLCCHSESVYFGYGYDDLSERKFVHIRRDDENYPNLADGLRIF